MSLKILNIKEISKKYTAYFFDLDGVIWRGNEKIKGGIQALKFLRENNNKIYFITNSSIRNRKMIKERLLSFGFQAEEHEIFPSDLITNLYIDQHYPNLKKLLVIGQPNLCDQLSKSGKGIVPIDNFNLIEGQSIGSIKSKMDSTIDGVVMGYDFTLNYSKIMLISFYVQMGAKFIGTNPDKYTMIQGMKIPGCGSMVKCIEEATSVTAEFAGKPNPFIIEYIIRQQKLSLKQCLMIGDNLETDIQFGINGGIDSLCVLTGVSSQKMVLSCNTATYYSQHLM